MQGHMIKTKKRAFLAYELDSVLNMPTGRETRLMASSHGALNEAIKLSFSEHDITSVCFCYIYRLALARQIRKRDWNKKKIRRLIMCATRRWLRDKLYGHDKSKGYKF